MTSGRCCRRVLWWATRAGPTVSNGRRASDSRASRVLIRPRRTLVRILRRRAGSIQLGRGPIRFAVFPARVRVGGVEDRRVRRGRALELFEVAPEERFGLGGGLRVGGLAGKRSDVLKGADVPSALRSHVGRVLRVP